MSGALLAQIRVGLEISFNKVVVPPTYDECRSVDARQMFVRAARFPEIVVDRVIQSILPEVNFMPGRRPIGSAERQVP